MSDMPTETESNSLVQAVQKQVRQLESEKQVLVQRVAEANVLYTLSALLTGRLSLDELLNGAAAMSVKVLNVKASSVRLLSEDGSALIPKAVCNLTTQYLKKGPIPLCDSAMARRVLKGEVVYVEDLRTDPDTLYREGVLLEGIVSMLSAPMSYNGRPIGTIRVYTSELRHFSESEQELLKAIGHMMAAAIEHARLEVAEHKQQKVDRQLQLAADVQRRMMPSKMPTMPPFDIAARYEASLELGGDFYDFIGLENNLGIVVGDVVGKGVAASLLMASVRSSLRAFTQDIYDLDQVMGRVNRAMERDTLDNEFATLFYGVFSPQFSRLTYCNGGHEPPMLLRDGELILLDIGGMIIGVDAQQEYEKSIIDLIPGDYLLMYTDGLTEAFNYADEQFGRERIESALRECAHEGMNAQTSLKHILWELRNFTGLRSPVDDTTIVMIRVTDEEPLPQLAK
ncbi:MAG: SpoIIE family protein phosphatase, partial [Phycisphaeraceae bacterium]|nr:SpoIIE family protein phosphatase [Phycisphaeraceae bacterium]